MAEWRMTERCQPWWISAVLIAFCAFFGWVAQTSLTAPFNPDVASHLIVPAYLLGVYLTLAALLDSHSVVVTPQGIAIRYGPVPVGFSETIGREQIALCLVWHNVTVSEESVIEDDHRCCVDTLEGRHVELWRFKDAIAARDAAYRIAYVLTARSPDSSLEVRFVGDSRSDRVMQRRLWTWVAAFPIAFALGGVWELMYRLSL
jgi:hypothetical protein